MFTKSLNIELEKGWPQTNVLKPFLKGFFKNKNMIEKNIKHIRGLQVKKV